LTQTVGPSKPSPGDLKNMEFEVVQEDWSKYDLADYTVIKGRLIVTRVAQLKHGPAGQFNLATIPIFAAFAQTHGEPSKSIPTPSEYAALEKEPVAIITSSEPWNKYRLVETGDIIQIKLVATEVFRLKDKFDEFGEPMYWISHTPVVAAGTKGTITIGPPKK
jgi:hypothetical protein